MFKILKRKDKKPRKLLNEITYIKDPTITFALTSEFTPSELKQAIHQFRGKYPVDTPSLLNLQKIFDVMMDYDPTLQGLIETRVLAITGKDYQFISADETKNAIEQADFCKNNIEKLFPGLLRELLYTRLRGVSVIEKIFDIQNNKIVLDKIKSYKRDLFRIKDGTIVYKDENGQVYELNEDKFIVLYEPMPILLPVAIFYLYKFYALKNWAIYSEIYGQPLRVGKYRQGSSKEDIQTLKDMVYNLGSDAAAVISENTLIDFIEASQKQASIAVYKDMAEYVDKCVAIRILGQAQTSDTQGQIGALAKAKVADLIRNDILLADAKWLEQQIDNISKQLCELNFSNPQPPSFDIITKPPVDMKQRIEIDEKLWNMGAVDFPEDYFHKTYNIPLQEPKKNKTVPALESRDTYMIVNIKGSPKSGQYIRKVAKIFNKFEKELQKSNNYDALFETIGDKKKKESFVKEYGEIFAEALKLAYLKGHYPKKKISASLRLCGKEDDFDIDYTLFDKKALKNFEEEAFIVAGINIEEALADIKKSAEKAISQGIPFMDFKNEIKLKGYTIENPYYLRTNFDTGINSAYLAGKWQDYEDTKDVFPYLKYKTVGDELVRESHAELDGYVLPLDDPFWDTYYPPNDWNCFDKDTEVYTNKGWLKFTELKNDELFLSLDPNNKNVEWVRSIRPISYHYKGKMIKIKGRNFNLIVTPNHNILIQKSWDRHEKRDKLKFIKASEIASGDRFYRTCQWKGIDKSIIKIAGLKFKTETFIKFMGYWLAEGSCSINNNNQYVIKIAQNNQINKEKIIKNLKDFPTKLWIGKDCIYIKPTKQLGEYLKQFGKSYEKYVPDIIKNMSYKYLKMFLNAYKLGDGYDQPAKIHPISGRICKGTPHYFTSSKKMADDLTEIILKCGKVPSINLMKNKGEKVKFNNGSYIINHDIWRIKETKYPYFNFRTYEEIDYNDMVYCVELEKYHILWVRRRGKTVWCGNCRCYTEQLTEEEASKERLFKEKPPHIKIGDEFNKNAGKTAHIFDKFIKEKE